MREYMENFKKYLEEIVNKNNIERKEIDEISRKITWFQHERLIHLIVTVSFCLFAILFMALGMISSYFLIIIAILIIFIIFYIYHYFYLENTVQYFYKLYDKIITKEKKRKEEV